MPLELSAWDDIILPVIALFRSDGVDTWWTITDLGNRWWSAYHEDLPAAITRGDNGEGFFYDMEDLDLFVLRQRTPHELEFNITTYALQCELEYTGFVAGGAE